MTDPGHGMIAAELYLSAAAGFVVGWLAALASLGLARWRRQRRFNRFLRRKAALEWPR